MTLLLKRCLAGLCRLVACSIAVALIAPSAATAQTRAAPPAKLHAPKAVQKAASPWVPNPAVNSKDSYLIVDAASGRELASDRPDELRHPASLTKLMTLYLAFSALDSGQLSLGDSLPVSLAALNASPTKMGLMGGSVNVRDAIMGLVTRSANDAAIVLGEALGGDEENFARMMTLKARQLGMTSTVYRNASGLPNREQVTTARDLAKLAHALMRDFPHYYPIFSVQSYPYRGRILANHNQMLQTYAGADGLKTGYTAASGFNLVMSAVRDNRRLIGVVMGGDTGYTRDRLMAELMDRGFEFGAGDVALGLDLSADPGLGPLRLCQLRAGRRFSRSRARGPGGEGGTGSGDARHRFCPCSHPAGHGVADGADRHERAHDRQLGDPGRLLQRQPFGRACARTRHSGIARSDPLAWIGHDRRSPDGAAYVPARAADQPLTGRSDRRLQETLAAQDLLLGAAGYGVEYPRRPLRAFASRATKTFLS